MGSDDGMSKVRDPIVAVIRWVKSRSPREKTLLGAIGGFIALLILWRVIEDHDTLFIMAEISHFLGYKIIRKRSVAGLSLETQYLTAGFLIVRLYCSFMMEYDIHTILDALTLAGTVGVVLFIVFSREISMTYQKDQDFVKNYYVIILCLALAAFAHPTTSHHFVFRVMWAFCVYLEAVSVFPQLRMMQKARVVERFTAHYVFALGLSRFLSCAHWVLQILDGNKYLLQALGSGWWPVMVLLSEVVQTFILADFCKFYIRSYAEGSGIVRLPAGIV
eukprot:gene24020-9595_t